MSYFLLWLVNLLKIFQLKIPLRYKDSTMENFLLKLTKEMLYKNADKSSVENYFSLF